MKKGDIYQGLADTVSFPGKGRVKGPDGDIIVKNVIPGQRVQLRITKKRSTHYEGRLLQVLESSPLEDNPVRCDIFPDCGGCVYQSMNYDAQVEMKYNQVKEVLNPILFPVEGEGTEDLFKGIYKSPESSRYRNKMEYTFGDEYKGGPLSLGLHKKNSNFDILTSKKCILVHEDFNRIVERVLDYCGKNGLEHYRKAEHRGFLRYLMIRRSESTGELMVALVTTTEQQWDFTPLVRELLRPGLSGGISGIIHMYSDTLSDALKCEKSEILYGRDWFFEEVLGLKFKITPFSFFQTNTKGSRVLYGIVRDMVGDVREKTVFDLYCGTGTISQIVAERAKRVIGVELVTEAVKAAKENAAGNGLDNCEFIEGDVFRVMESLREVPQVLILDPPREGINPRALPRLLEYKAEQIIYVSCKVTSLARDLQVILEGGYRVEEIKAVDMFPNTAGIECVVHLLRVKTKQERITKHPYRAN